MPDGDHNEKLLSVLEKHLQADDRRCPFVIKGAAASDFALQSFRGGRDAVYVTVAKTSPDAINPEIHFADDLDSTSLIYDATAGCLQGKARPFVCDLTAIDSRIYVVLPYQIEGIASAIEQSARAVLEVWHVDASEAAIPAALPFVLAITDARGETKVGYRSTNHDGRRHEQLPAPESNTRKIAIKSLLTDWQTIIEHP